MKIGDDNGEGGGRWREEMGRGKRKMRGGEGRGKGLKAEGSKLTLSDISYTMTAAWAPR